MMHAKWKVITSVMVLIFCLCISYTLFFLHHRQIQLEHIIDLHAEGMHNVAAAIQEQTGSQYQKRIENFVNFHTLPSQEKLLQSFADRNHAELLQRSLPFLRIFKKENPNFLSFSWILPDNTTFLRVHEASPSNTDISETRPDIAMANKTHQQYSGFAITPMGLRYRIINPVKYKNKLLGVIQFSLRGALFVDAIYDKLHVPVGLIIPNEKFQVVAHSKIPILTGQNFSLQSSQIGFFKDIFSSINWGLDKQQVVIEGKDYILMKVFTLLDYNQAPQAYLFAALDISEQLAVSRQHVILIAALSGVLMIFSFLIIYFSYGSLVTKIAELQIVEQVNTVLEKKVTERTQTLAEREQYLKSIFNAPSDAIFIHDSKTFSILDVNQAMLELFAVTREEAMKFSIAEFSLNEYPYDQEQIARKMALTLNEGPQVFEWLARRKTGELFWTEVGLTLTEFGDRSYVIAVVRNIDAKKRMENEMLKVKKLESVAVLAGGIAHDFNNILSAILGNLELASLLVGKDHKAFPLLADAQKASSRATKLTQQLLTFAKGGNPVREATSLPQLIKESSDFVLRGSSVSCSYDFPEDLRLVDIDTGQISQVIQNLILNARHAMPSGGAIDIRCSNIGETDVKELPTLPPGKYVKVMVQDTGTGISTTVIDKIFDPYFTTKHDGSGLGLAICHSIVNKHKGHITVHSTPGEGTVFSVYLPVTNETADSPEKETAASDVSQSARIMVMDDDTMLRSIASSLLEHLGHEVILVVDGDEAITRYRELQDAGEPVDIIIMDLTIPGGMGGKEAIGEILKINPEAKVVVASGYANDPVMADCKAFGFIASIAKPFNLEELNRTLKSIL